MYQLFNLKFNKDLFLNIFDLSEKDSSSDAYTKSKFDLLDLDEIKEIFKYFDFIPYDRRSIELTRIEKQVRPYVNPNNNGLILLPLTGSLEIEFFSHVPEYKDNRPILNPLTKKSDELLETIYKSRIEKIEINSPVAFNGLIPHCYSPIGNFTSIILKIPYGYDWNKIKLEGTNYEIL
jgi:hypothetical protein